jgi:hypothetical protein
VPLLRATTSVSSLIAVAQMAPALGLAAAALEHTLEILGKGRTIGTSIYRNAIRSPSTSPPGHASAWTSGR